MVIIISTCLYGAIASNIIKIRPYNQNNGNFQKIIRLWYKL